MDDEPYPIYISPPTKLTEYTEASFEGKEQTEIHVSVYEIPKETRSAYMDVIKMALQPKNNVVGFTLKDCIDGSLSDDEFADICSLLQKLSPTLKRITFMSVHFKTRWPIFLSMFLNDPKPADSIHPSYYFSFISCTGNIECAILQIVREKSNYLQRLSISGTILRPHMLGELLKVLLTAHNLTHLDLTSNFIDDTIAALVSDLIVRSYRLRKLILVNCKLQPIGAARIAGAIPTSTSLGTIHAHHNTSMGDSALQMLMAAIFGISKSIKEARLDMLESETTDKKRFRSN